MPVWVPAGLFLSASFLGACSGDSEGDSEEETGASACSVFLIESPPDGVEPVASTRRLDIERAIRGADESLDAETPPTAAEWDLVVTGRIGVTPDGGCGSYPGLDDLTVLDVIVRGSDADDSWWAVLIQTDADLEAIDRVALNGRVIDLSH